MKPLHSALLAVALMLLAACGQSAAAPTALSTPTAQDELTLHVQDAWLYPPAIDNTAVYFTLINPGPADKLLSVSAADFQTAELHQTMNMNNMSSMQTVSGGVDVPANGSLAFQPGGYHVMLVGPKRTLIAGDSVTLTLTFARASPLTVQAMVKAP